VVARRAAVSRTVWADWANCRRAGSATGWRFRRPVRATLFSDDTMLTLFTLTLLIVVFLVRLLITVFCWTSVCGGRM
jgi:hypothetical protein